MVRNAKLPNGTQKIVIVILALAMKKNILKSRKVKKMLENIEYSKDWITQEIIKTDFEQRKTNQIQYIKMTKIDLLKLVQKFIKLNEKGE